MKKTKITLLISLLFFGLFFVFTSKVSAEVIRDFSSTINVMPDSSIIVKEKISYDFEDVLRHGITRTIPLFNSKNEPIKIEIISVALNDNDNYKFTTDITNNILTIKIGDPSMLISSMKEYTIVYRVLGSISYYDNFDEIYWNATGNDWQVSILKSEVSVILPNNVFSTQQSCYYGKPGSKVQCNISDTNVFSSNSIINAKEGLTVAVGFSKGVVATYSNIIKIDKYEIPKTFWPLFIPIIVFILMFIRWFKKGRDPKGTGVIIPQYDVPENLTPIEVGVIINDEIKNKNISAEIIYLATKGYIKIKQVEPDRDNYLCLIKNKDYELTLLKEEGLLNNIFDKKILKAIFGDNAEIGGKSLLSSLNNNFYKSIKDINESVINTLLIKKYYLNFPKMKLHISFIFIGIWIAFMFNIFLNVLGNTDSVSTLFKVILFVSIILSIIIFLIFNNLMPAKSIKGVALKEYLLGLKEYLQIAEKDRLNFHNAPDKKPEIFESLLPYAMVFRVEELWAKEFKDIYNNPPQWYENKSSSFTIINFGHEISIFNTAASSILSSSSSNNRVGMSGSSGGGFSGGGGGGGGGGSW